MEGLQPGSTPSPTAYPTSGFKPVIVEDRDQVKYLRTSEAEELAKVTKVAETLPTELVPKTHIRQHGAAEARSGKTLSNAQIRKLRRSARKQKKKKT